MKRKFLEYKTSNGDIIRLSYKTYYDKKLKLLFPAGSLFLFNEEGVRYIGRTKK